jgi:hypothetical protein
MIAEPRIVEFAWNPKQSRFILSISKYLSLSGGVRAGKTWALCFKVWQWTQKYPGIRIVLSRWSDDNLQAQLVPQWRGMCRKVGASPEWNAKEEAEEFSNGSIVYLRSLKSSDDSQRFSKLAGLTISVLAIDQGEEAEADVIRHYVPARLSQPGFPHAFWITPNPSLPTHWTSEWWPEDDSRPGYEYIHTTPYDNRINLGEEYITDLESAYEPGSLEHRRLILGKRGLMVAGDPIYGPHFNEALHVGVDDAPPVKWDPRLPLLESWDFGTLRPAVVYGQFPIGGRMHVLGGIRGQRLPLDQFVPLVLETREKWFPGLDPAMVMTTCDPAGQAPNSHGSRTAVETLRSYGVYPVVHENANDPRIRAGCIEEIVGYLRRRAHDGAPLFKLNPRFVLLSTKGPKYAPMLQEVFEGGYCYDPKKTYHGTQYQGITPPLKDKLYEDLANAVEYLVYAFAPPDAAFRAGFIQNPADARRAKRTMQEHAGTGSVVEDQREILERLDAVSRLPLRPEERARIAGQLTQARSGVEAARISRRALALAQRDSDPADRMGSGLSRGGYVRIGRR